MKGRYYKVVISADDNVNYEFNPICYAKTMVEAVEIARPWDEQGYDIAISTAINYEEAGSYIEIPLDTWEDIKNLTKEQAGIIFKSIYKYFFDGKSLSIEDPELLELTKKQIMKISEVN